MRATRSLGLLALWLAGCAQPPAAAGGQGTDASVAEGVLFRADAWADNWFSLAVNGQQVAEDTVPITTERSFNRESFPFEARYPLVLAFVLKDYKQDDSGLEYIGQPNQKIGDGGFIFQLFEAVSGRRAEVSGAHWRCLPIHRAPLNPSCEKDPHPSQTCQIASQPEPPGWREASFDDGAWPAAVEFAAAEVGPKDGYAQVSWDAAARFVWSADLKVDNTVLCRALVQAP